MTSGFFRFHFLDNVLLLDYLRAEFALFMGQVCVQLLGAHGIPVYKTIDTVWQLGWFMERQKKPCPIEDLYFLFRPALILCDASLIRNVLSKDFNSFHDRGFYHNPSDPVAALFMQPGQDWKSIRSKLTPTFTTGKLKSMMPSVIQITENFKRKMSLVADNSEVTDLKELSIRWDNRIKRGEQPLILK